MKFMFFKINLWWILSAHSMAQLFLVICRCRESCVKFRGKTIVIVASNLRAWYFVLRNANLSFLRLLLVYQRKGNTTWLRCKMLIVFSSLLRWTFLIIIYLTAKTRIKARSLCAYKLLILTIFCETLPVS